jgi:hypothetical protein
MPSPPQQPVGYGHPYRLLTARPAEHFAKTHQKWSNVKNGEVDLAYLSSLSTIVLMPVLHKEFVEATPDKLLAF